MNQPTAAKLSILEERAPAFDGSSLVVQGFGLVAESTSKRGNNTRTTQAAGAGRRLASQQRGSNMAPAAGEAAAATGLPAGCSEETEEQAADDAGSKDSSGSSWRRILPEQDPIQPVHPPQQLHAADTDAVENSVPALPVGIMEIAASNAETTRSQRADDGEMETQGLPQLPLAVEGSLTYQALADMSDGRRGDHSRARSSTSAAQLPSKAVVSAAADGQQAAPSSKRSTNGVRSGSVQGLACLPLTPSPSVQPSQSDDVFRMSDSSSSRIILDSKKRPVNSASSTTSSSSTTDKKKDRKDKPDSSSATAVTHDSSRVRVLCRFRKVLDGPTEWAARHGGWLDFDAESSGSGGEHGDVPDTVTIRVGSGWSRRGFDKVFGPGVGQEKVYEQVERVANGVAQGFNGTLFAYGQTGSGKTYTMGGAASTLSYTPPAPANPQPSGVVNGVAAVATSTPATNEPSSDCVEEKPSFSPPTPLTLPPDQASVSPASLKMPPPPSPLARVVVGVSNGGGMRTGESIEGAVGSVGLGAEAGVIPRAVSTVLAEANARKAQGWEFVLTATYVEIYNERIRDLLDPANDNLKVKEHPGRGVEAAGACEVRVFNLEEAIGVLKDGARHRMTAATLMNQASSRSHSIFILRLDQRHVVSDCKVSARLTLVDLAGSERAGQTGAEGRRLEEANSINVSLHTLGRVIRALSESAPHVPFRDSKLTRLLQESLGGNSRTVLIVCCSPDESQAQETLSTLKFGECAKRVTTFASANVVAAPHEVAAQLSELRAEVVRLKRQLHDAHLREARRTEEAMLSSARRSRRASIAAAGGRATGGSGGLHRKWGPSPLSRTVSFNASYGTADSAGLSSGDESWSAAANVWEEDEAQEAQDDEVEGVEEVSSWTGPAGGGAPSPSTPAWKRLDVPKSPLASPMGSPVPSSKGSSGSGRRRARNWTTGPAGVVPAARRQRESGRGVRKGNVSRVKNRAASTGGSGDNGIGSRRRLWTDGDEGRQGRGSNAAVVSPPPSALRSLSLGGVGSAPIGVRTGGDSGSIGGSICSGDLATPARTTPAASGSDGVRRRWTRREGGGSFGRGSWRQEVAHRDSPVRSARDGEGGGGGGGGREDEGVKPRAECDPEIPVEAAAAAAAKSAACVAGSGVDGGVGADRGDANAGTVCASPTTATGAPEGVPMAMEEEQDNREEATAPTLAVTSLPVVGGIRRAAEGAPDQEQGAVEAVATDQPSLPRDDAAERLAEAEGELRSAVVRITRLSKNWDDRAQAYEKLLQMKNLEIESLVLAHRLGVLSDQPNPLAREKEADFTANSTTRKRAASSASHTPPPACTPRSTMSAKSSPSTARPRRSPLHGVTGNSSTPAAARGSRHGTPKQAAGSGGSGRRSSSSSRPFSMTPPPPPPSPMRPSDLPFRLDTDTDDY